MNPPEASCEARSVSTAARRSGLPAQAASRNAVRSSGGFRQGIVQQRFFVHRDLLVAEPKFGRSLARSSPTVRLYFVGSMSS